jgi:phosphoglycolate phosphatase-like HAD superfamily hydrolase
MIPPVGDADADVILASMGLARLFERVVCGAIGAPQPAPEGLLRILGDLGNRRTRSTWGLRSRIEVARTADIQLAALWEAPNARPLPRSTAPNTNPRRRFDYSARERGRRFPE